PPRSNSQTQKVRKTARTGIFPGAKHLSLKIKKIVQIADNCSGWDEPNAAKTAKNGDIGA
ncbi:MAG: hypothetical protein KAR47_16875, partial [Planctomycetes bacterium]|nr:hypothetical protein [Planctomycetota bacterium]